MANKINKIEEFETKPYHTRVSWLDAFAQEQAKKKASKTGLEASRERDKKSLFEQILFSGTNAKIANKMAVEAVVQDYQEKTGLKSYLNDLQRKAEDKETPDSSPIPQDLMDKIEIYVHNLVESHHGSIGIMGVLDSIGKTFGRQGLEEDHINDENLAQFINQELINYHTTHPTSELQTNQLGKGLGLEDIEEETDALKGMMPVTD